MKKYLSKLIHDAIVEASSEMLLDKDRTILFVERNVPGISYDEAKRAVNDFYVNKYTPKIRFND